MKKSVSIILIAVLILSSVLVLAGCGNGEFPVDVANFTVDKEPEKIVVLDPSSADIISYMGYDRKMVGRSDEVDQDFLAVAPSVGSATAPNVQSIIDTDADIVFAGDNLSAEIKAQLEEQGVKVLTMSLAETPKQLETNYRTIGKILGGKITGENKGAESYTKLIDAMERLKSDANVANNTNALDTVCYLYYENDQLKFMTSGTYCDMLLGYTGAINVAVNIEENFVDVNTLKVANPNYIFYADEATLNAMQSDSVLSKLTALTSGKALEISNVEITRQGLTAVSTLEKMIAFIHPETNATPDEAKAVDATVSGEQATEKAAEATAAEEESVAKDYKIELKDLTLKYEDENDNVKAVQQRLFDLGYVDDEENITGYYGDVTKKAIQDFQKKNGIKETGNADNATLVAIFNKNAKKAS